MPSNPIKVINVAGCLGQVIDLAAVDGTIASGPFSGRACRLKWGGGWQIQTDRFVPLGTIDMREEISVSSPVGVFRIEKPYPSRSVSGRVSGKAIALHYESGHAKATRRIGFRLFVAAEQNDSDILLPQSYRDPTTAFVGQWLLPLKTSDGNIDVFFLKEGPYWVLEMSDAEATAETFERVSSMTRRLLTYLTGVRFDADHYQVEFDLDTNEVLAAHWFRGTKQRQSQYTPIPIHYSVWMAAREKYSIPGMRGGLDAEVISKCISTLLQHPDLHVALEYLLVWHDEKIEMRGVFLSVALEALTDYLQKIEAINKEKLLEKELWHPLRDALLATLDSTSPSRTGDQTKVLRERIHNMNNATNAQKLKRGFAALGLSLSPEQEEAIKKRDKFLHEGRILREEDRATSPEPWKLAYQVEMHLFTAISKLFLKYLGYSGPMMDWGKMPIDHFEPMFDTL